MRGEAPRPRLQVRPPYSVPQPALGDDGYFPARSGGGVARRSRVTAPGACSVGAALQGAGVQGRAACSHAPPGLAFPFMDLLLSFD